MKSHCDYVPVCTYFIISVGSDQVDVEKKQQILPPKQTMRKGEKNVSCY